MAKEIQLLNVDGVVVTKTGIFSKVDDTVQKLYETGDEREILSAVIAMKNVGKVSGLAYAKLLWNWNNWYTATGQAEKRNDTFEDMIVSDVGTEKITTKRYILTWSYIEDCVIPKEVQERRMDDLVKISTALSQGYDFSKETWKKLARASNSSEVGEILRLVKGKQARKSGMQIVLTRDGSLNAWQNEKKHFVGYLEINSDDEVVQKAIQRIIDNSGIQEK